MLRHLTMLRQHRYIIQQHLQDRTLLSTCTAATAMGTHGLVLTQRYRYHHSCWTIHRRYSNGMVSSSPMNPDPA